MECNEKEEEIEIGEVVEVGGKDRVTRSRSWRNR